MNAKRLQTTGTALALMLGSVLWGGDAARSQTIQPKFEEYAPLADMRTAGIQGDRSQIPAMIKALTPHATPYHIMTALRALSELQATEALPAIDAVIVCTKGSSYAGFARVVRARIMAESEIRPLTATASKQGARKDAAPIHANARNNSEAGATLDRFLSLLNLDTAKMKAAVAKPTDGTTPTVAKDPEGTAMWAQQEIADMALHSDPSYLTLPQVKELDYTEYPGPALKMKIAPMSHEERVKWLIDDLSRKKSMSWKEDEEAQLAIDEGLAASHYAASTLQRMKEHQKDYPPIGFHALFMVLDGVADKKDNAIIATFESNPDPKIAHSSGEYPHYKHQMATGF